jgi:hypothetical protein
MLYDVTVMAVASAVVALCDGDRPGAEKALLGIDFAAVRSLRTKARTVWAPDGVARGHKSQFPGTKRTSPRAADIRTAFARDRYTCRYAHCGRPTIALDVLKLLSRAFPDIMPYQSNWRPVDRHILYWVYSASLEHHVAFPAGGTSDASNLLTACYLCNDVKNCIPAEVLGWKVLEPADSSWSGLTEFLPRLRTAVAHTVSC